MTTAEGYKEAMRKLEDWHKFTTYVQPLLSVIKGRVAYLEGAIERYERHISSGPHTYSEEFFVQVTDGERHGGASPVDDGAIFGIKQLAEPTVVSGAHGIKIHAQGEPLLDASRVNGTEKLGGLDVEQSCSSQCELLAMFRRLLQLSHNTGGPWKV